VDVRRKTVGLDIAMKQLADARIAEPYEGVRAANECGRVGGLGDVLPGTTYYRRRHDRIFLRNFDAGRSEAKRRRERCANEDLTRVMKSAGVHEKPSMTGFVRGVRITTADHVRRRGVYLVGR
jgi:hypothetical protein